MERIADYKGLQGKAYRVWKTPEGSYEVEMIWGGNGVFFTTDKLEEVEKLLARLGAKKLGQ